MRISAFVLLAATVAFGQTTSKPALNQATQPAKAQAAAAKAPATVTKAPAAAAKPTGDMPVVHTLPKPLFTERYIDMKVGTGAPAEPNKVYHVHYSGYFADTGKKFDSSYDHKTPVMKDGKPVLDASGQPQTEAQPLVFPQGTGRLIPGFDQGMGGMRVGGKRRIFIPYQLAYGEKGRPGPDAAHPGIPPKAELIFDVELMDVTEMPQAPAQPAPPARPVASPAGAAPTAQPRPATPAAPPAPSAPATPPTPAPPTPAPAPGAAAQPK
jgi:peptidylprolyl isomerase